MFAVIIDHLDGISKAESRLGQDNGLRKRIFAYGVGKKGPSVIFSPPAQIFLSGIIIQIGTSRPYFFESASLRSSEMFVEYGPGRADAEVERFRILPGVCLDKTVETPLVLTLHQYVQVVVHRANPYDTYFPPPCLPAKDCKEHQEIGHGVEKEVTADGVLVNMDYFNLRRFHLAT